MAMAQTTARTLALVLAVGVVAAAWVVPGEGLASTGTLWLPSAAPDTCLLCVDDCGQQEDQHYAWDEEFVSEDYYRNGGAHIGEPYCRSNICDVKHGPWPCTETLAMSDVEGLRAAVQAGDSRQIARFLVKDKHVQLNVPRSALQLLGCQGSVVEHHPLTAGLVDAILEATRDAVAGDD
jgi:hypothetical protein